MNDDRSSNYIGYGDDGFENYSVTTASPGNWLLILTASIAASLFLLVFPITKLCLRTSKRVRRKRYRRHLKTISAGDSEGKNELEEEILPYDSDSDEEASYQGSVMSTDSQMSAASGLILKRKKETESIIEMQQWRANRTQIYQPPTPSTTSSDDDKKKKKKKKKRSEESRSRRRKRHRAKMQFRAEAAAMLRELLHQRRQPPKPDGTRNEPFKINQKDFDNLLDEILKSDSSGSELTEQLSTEEKEELVYVLMEQDEHSIAPHVLAKASKLMAAGGDFDDVTEGKKCISSFWRIVRVDRESKRILRYTVPFTVYAVAERVMESIVLALVGHFVGTKQVAAYAIVEVLFSLTDEFLDGPFHALTTLCSHAVGAGNCFLAGQYVQASIALYFVASVPIMLGWFFFIDDAILLLGWGDEEVAAFASEFVRIAIWSSYAHAVHHGIGELLDVTGHEVVATTIGLVEGGVELVAIVFIIWMPQFTLTLELVATIQVVTAFVFLFITMGLTSHMGWLGPFKKGLLQSSVISNGLAISNMVKTSVPLAFGSILDNAAWAVLTVFAAYMGEAEVAAWAILGTIWGLVESLSSGIGDAAEIRVSYHLGNNHPFLAKLSAYKSLLIAMVGAAVVSIVFFCVLDQIPGWFTVDSTLQEMLAGTLPYVIVGDLAATFTTMCWYMLGAQGRFKFATWLNFLASWGITIPLAAYFTYNLEFNMEGLVAALVLGYVCTGVFFTVVFLSSDWVARARKISRRNRAHGGDDASDSSDHYDPVEENAFAAFASRKSRAARSAARQNTKVLVAPPGPINLDVALLPLHDAFVVTSVPPNSPFEKRVFPGDVIMSVDGHEISSRTSENVLQILYSDVRSERHLIILTTTYHYRDEDTSQILLDGTVPDIQDCDSIFDETEMEERLS